MKININLLKNILNKKNNIYEVIEKLTFLGFESLKVKDYINIDIPYNRPDCDNIFSVLNEIKRFDKNFSFNIFNFKQLNLKLNKNVHVSILKKNVCPIYFGVILEKISIKKRLPNHIIDLLLLNDISLSNDIINVINYCTLITGQPFHCYNLESINKSITLSESEKDFSFFSKKNDKIKIEKYTPILKSNYIDLSIPGIIESYDSKVTDNVKNIFVECAFFESYFIKDLYKKITIKTDSGNRFSNKVNFNLTKQAFYYLINLFYYCFNCDLSIIKPNITKMFFPKQNKIKISKDKLLNIFTSSQHDKRIVKCVKNVFLVKKYSKNFLTFNIPYDRSDITSEENIFSELIKLYGTNNLNIHNLNFNFIKSENINDKLRDFFKVIGFNEIISYSFVNYDKEILFSDKNKLIFVENPMSENMNVLRNTLIQGLLESVNFNSNRQQIDLKLFEIGNTYNKINSFNFNTEEHMSVIISDKLKDNYENFFNLKSLAQEILYSIYRIKKFDLIKSKCFYLDTEINSSIIFNKKEIAKIGLIKKSILTKFNLKQNTYFFNLNLNNISNLVKESFFKSISKYPTIIRDLSFIIKNDIVYTDILKFIKKLNIKFLTKIIYINSFNIDKNINSLTFRFKFQDMFKTLKEGEILLALDYIRYSLKLYFDIDLNVK